MKYLLIAIVFFSLSANAQECNYKTAERDKFTQEIILETEPIRFHWKNEFLSMSMKRQGDLRYLVVNFNIFHTTKFSLVKGSKLLLLDEDEKLVTLYPVINDLIDLGEVNFSKYGNSVSFKIYFTLNDSIYSELENFIPVAARLYGNDTYHDIDKFKGPRNKSQIPTFFKDAWYCVNRSTKYD